MFPLGMVVLSIQKPGNLRPHAAAIACTKVCLIELDFFLISASRFWRTEDSEAFSLLPRQSPPCLPADGTMKKNILFANRRIFLASG